MTIRIEDFEARGPYLRPRWSSDRRYRRARWVAAAAAAVVAAWFLVGSESGLVGVLMLQKRVSELDHRLETLQHRRAELRARLDLMRNDPRTIERVAREVYGLARGEEIVYLLPGCEAGPGWRQAPAPSDILASRSPEEMALDTSAPGR
jgi:cell division protein FtsB